MRSILFITLLVMTSGVDLTRNVANQSGKLDGIWLPIKQELSGKNLPAAAFDKQKLVISDSTYTFTAESIDKGTVKYSDDKMDIYGKEGVNTGKHFMAIYKFENDQLTICYNLKGDKYPEAFDTKSKSLFFLCVFKRDAAK
ncbi:MAG TPA: TIGR03067 domain-containing protein [Mucilaginibacter sp.]|nr:TIGR03067 domain-containing protein [Mucilaginibacter sp.]